MFFSFAELCDWLKKSFDKVDADIVELLVDHRASGPMMAETAVRLIEKVKIFLRNSLF